MSGTAAGTCAARGVWISSIGMLAAVAWAQPAAAAPHDDYLKGQALFSGTIELHGRIYTHVTDMPPSVVRCSNCHAVADGPDVPRSQAPRLTPGWLILPRARRGGPPSHYSRDGFCTLLRKGVDPAFVMVSVEMPRYSIDDVDCGALWRYLTGSHREANAR